ncbi:MAG: cytochrome c, partial [Gammaproteobacteria bacterium]
MRKQFATLGLLLSVHGAALAEGQDAIDYRKHIMQSLQEQVSALGMIMSGTIPDDNAVAHMEIIAATAKTALKSFEPKVEGGDAEPEVWSNWADFSARMQDFVTKSAEMA